MLESFIFLLLPMVGAFQNIKGNAIVAESKFGKVYASELYREIALKYGREKKYYPLLDDLINVEIVVQEIKKQKIKIDEALIKKRINEAKAAARSKGKRLEDFLKATGISLDTMIFYTKISIAKEMLAGKALGKDWRYITRAQVNLWFSEIKKKYKIIKNLKNLESGTAAWVNGKSIPIDEYGWVITASLRKNNPEVLKQVICSIISGRRIRELAEKEGIKVTEEDEIQEIERRRKNVKNNPKWHGASLDQLLEAKGSSIELLRRSRTFHDFILLKKLMWKIYPKEKQIAFFNKYKKDYLDHFGETRHVFHIAVKINPGGREKSYKQALKLKRIIKGPTSFRLYARIYSADKISGPKGGDLGFLHRIEPGIPEKILEKAFSLKIGEIGGPVEVNGVFHLILVTEIKPPPPLEELLKHVRADLRKRILRKIIDEADIKYYLNI